MRFGMITASQATMLLVSSICYAQDLTPEQTEPWSTLATQVRMDANRDFTSMKQYMHPRGSFWGNHLPHPISNRSYNYCVQLRAGEDEITAHHVVPVSVIVVGDVAIIDAYLHLLSRSNDDEQKEKIFAPTQHLEEGKRKMVTASDLQH
ncbi:MAG: hypothetical protein CMM01_19895 [Rhodopirellula sp.]|nr:hypothetical protein [Rhodopirellula sp.]